MSKKKEKKMVHEIASREIQHDLVNHILNSIIKNAEQTEDKDKQPRPGDLVVIEVGTAPFYELKEFFILESFENLHKVQDNKGVIRFVRHKDIVQKLGECPFSRYAEFGQKDPRPTVTPENYTTGTYVIDLPKSGGLGLVEVDRVGDTYYIHGVSDHYCVPLNDNLWEDLEPLSDPDQGDYHVEPGLYMNLFNHVIEIVPYKNNCYYRYLDESALYQLHSTQIKEIQRVESDTIEINHAILVPVDNPDCTPKTATPTDTCGEEKCCGNPQECDPPQC